MRLLTRDTSGQIYVTEDLAENLLPRYAVLSHTWGADGDEVTLQNVANGSAVRKPGFAKVQFCLEQAERDGMRHCWVDTCCIDKMNQVELNESIVSMFRWFQNAHRCYVYLSDVPSADAPVNCTDELYGFKLSRWFRRGWTLQELLAPQHVIFFNKKREQLGTKLSMEGEISAASQIPVKALQSTSFEEFPIAERFAWQNLRETRKPEDLAYSLLGLFDVSMSIIYGEGHAKARQRLEEEIRKSFQGMQHQDYTVTPSLDVNQVHDFIGRTQELETMKRELSSDGRRKYCTIHGLGGMGKTQLALQYATRYKHKYSAILWLNIDTQDTVVTSFIKEAKHMLSQPNGRSLGIKSSDTEPFTVVDAVKNWLSLPQNTRWLMIFDNYDDPKVPGNTSPTQVDIRKFLPTAFQGSIIITTRSANVNLGHTIHLRKLGDPSESIKVLSTTSRRPELSQDPFTIQLVQELDGLPLALATAGAYLSRSSMSIERYLKLYRSSWAALQENSSTVGTYEDRKLYSTWQITFHQIKQLNPLSANFLHVAAYFANEDIWFQLLKHSPPNGPEWIVELTRSEVEFDAALQILCNYSLVDKAADVGHRTESNGYSMHKCVHSWTKSCLQNEKDSRLVAYALNCVAYHVPYKQQTDWWITQRRLASHGLHCYSAYINKPDNENEDNSGTSLKPERILRLFGKFYYRQGEFSVAENLYKQAMEASLETLGPDHQNTLNIFEGLGKVYERQDKLEMAEDMYKRALEGQERVFGPEHKKSLVATENLARLYQGQKKFEIAEEMLQRALPLVERERGPDHVNILGIIHTLGLLYKEQGKLAKAEEMLQRTVQRAENTLGPNHVTTLDIVHSFGDLCYAQGKLDKAVEMLQRALKGTERALGPDHSRTLEIVHRLSWVYGEQNKLEIAEETLQRALEGYNKDPVRHANIIEKVKKTIVDLRSRQTLQKRKVSQSHEILQRPKVSKRRQLLEAVVI